MKLLCRAFTIGVLLIASCTAYAAPQIPAAPAGWVTDTAGFISSSTRQKLDERLRDYELRTHHQVLVWIGESTGDAPTEEWTARTFEAWHVGRKGIDDGLVLFIFAKDRKARIEVGYGLEGVVPDATASRIIHDAIIPRIQAGNRDEAVTAGVDQLLASIGGAGPSSGRQPALPQPLSTWQIIGLALLAILIISLAIRYPTVAFYLITSLMRGDGRRRDGFGIGGFRGGGGRSGGGGATGRW